MDKLLILIFILSFLYVLRPRLANKTEFVANKELYVPYLLSLAYFLITLIICNNAGLRLMTNYQFLIVFVSATTYLALPFIFFALKTIDCAYNIAKSKTKPILENKILLYSTSLRGGKVLSSAAINIAQKCLEIWLLAFPLLVVFYCYSHLKALIPMLSFINSFDPLFWKIENELLPQLALSKFNKLLENCYVDLILQFSYHSLTFYYSIILGALYFGKKRHLLGRILSALIICFFIANILYYVIPTDGPVFYKPSAFYINPNGSIWMAQKWLYSQRAKFLSDPLGYDVRVFNGIAGFPSMHIAQTLILLIAVHVAVPRLFLPALLYEILVIISTLTFGWHYLIDDIAGILIAWCSYKIATRLCIKYGDAEEKITIQNS